MQRIQKVRILCKRLSCGWVTSHLLRQAPFRAGVPITADSVAGTGKKTASGKIDHDHVFFQDSGEPIRDLLCPDDPARATLRGLHLRVGRPELSSHLSSPAKSMTMRPFGVHLKTFPSCPISALDVALNRLDRVAGS